MLLRCVRGEVDFIELFSKLFLWIVPFCNFLLLQKQMPLGLGVEKYVGFRHQTKETLNASHVSRECLYLWAFCAMLLCTVASWVRTSCFW